MVRSESFEDTLGVDASKGHPCDTPLEVEMAEYRRQYRTMTKVSQELCQIGQNPWGGAQNCLTSEDCHCSTGVS